MRSASDAPAVEFPKPLPLIRGPSGYSLLLGVTLLTYVYSHLPPTGANEQAWALSLVNFLFLTGGAAGAIIVGTVVYTLGIERLRPVARIAELVAISCLVLTGVFLVSDLSRPAALWSRLRDTDLASPLGWDVVAISIYLGNGIGLGYLATWLDPLRATTAMPAGQRLPHLLAVGRAALAAASAPDGRRLLRELVAIFAPTAVLLHSIPAWILRHLKASPDSGAAMIALPVIASSAVISFVLGLALVIVVTTASRIRLRAAVTEDVIRDLGAGLLILIGLLGLCLLAEMEATRYASAGVHVLHEMIAGPSAPLFWFVLLGGVIVPFLLLWFSPTGGVGFAALLVVVGVLTERWNIAIPPLLGHAHLPYTDGGYAPTGRELALTVGTYAVALLAYLVLAKLVSVHESGQRR